MKDQFQQKRILMERQLAEQKKQVRTSKFRGLSATDQLVLLVVDAEKAKNRAFRKSWCILTYILTFSS